jgi:hypothetical protein
MTNPFGFDPLWMFQAPWTQAALDEATELRATSRKKGFETERQARRTRVQIALGSMSGRLF